MNIENQETITFDEFRSWLAGLIRGKNGALPDLEDWKVIKRMIDKVTVEHETTYIPIPAPPYPPCSPAQPHFEPPPFWGPNTADPYPNSGGVWCSSNVEHQRLDGVQYYSSLNESALALDQAFAILTSSTESKEV